MVTGIGTDPERMSHFTIAYMGSSENGLTGSGFGREQTMLGHKSSSSSRKPNMADFQTSGASTDDGNLAEGSAVPDLECEEDEIPERYEPEWIPSEFVDVTSSKFIMGLDPAKHTTMMFRLDSPSTDAENEGAPASIVRYGVSDAPKTDRNKKFSNGLSNFAGA